MRGTTFCNETPVAEIRDGLVHIEIGGEPMVTCRLATARKFCERTMRKLDKFEAEQALRVVELRAKHS